MWQYLWRLLITFATICDPDQNRNYEQIKTDRHSDSDPDFVFINFDTKALKYTACKELL